MCCRAGTRRKPLRHYVACDEVGRTLRFRHSSRTAEPAKGDPRCRTTISSTATKNEGELASLLLGAGFALASLIILPAIAQRVGIGSSLTIALRGALMRAANRL
jgi:hypothetical protein